MGMNGWTLQNERTLSIFSRFFGVTFSELFAQPQGRVLFAPAEMDDYFPARRRIETMPERRGVLLTGDPASWGGTCCRACSSSRQKTHNADIDNS
jgi:hypothetical protein